MAKPEPTYLRPEQVPYVTNWTMGEEIRLNGTAAIWDTGTSCRAISRNDPAMTHPDISQELQPIVDPDVILASASAMRTRGFEFGAAATDTIMAWNALTTCYSGPGQDEIWTALHPISLPAASFAVAVNTVANALTTFAFTIEPILDKLRLVVIDAGQLGREIRGFRPYERSPQHRPYATSSTPPGLGIFNSEVLPDQGNSIETWDQDPDLVWRNARLIQTIHEQTVLYQEAERTCANAINALYGGTEWVPITDTTKSTATNAYGLDAETMADIDQGWGIAPKLTIIDTTPGWERYGNAASEAIATGLLDDATFMVNAVGLFGPDGSIWNWRTAAQTWMNLGSTVYDAVTPPAAVITEDGSLELKPVPNFDFTRGEWREIPSPLAAMGRELFAQDQWGVDNAAAAGTVTGNIISFFIPGPEEVLRAVRSVRGVADAASTTSRVLDAPNLSANYLDDILDGTGHLPQPRQLQLPGFEDATPRRPIVPDSTPRLPEAPSAAFDPAQGRLPGVRNPLATGPQDGHTYTPADVAQAAAQAPRNPDGVPVDWRTGEPLRDGADGRRGWYMQRDAETGEWIAQNPGAGNPVPQAGEPALRRGIDEAWDPAQAADWPDPNPADRLPDPDPRGDQTVVRSQAGTGIDLPAPDADFIQSAADQRNRWIDNRAAREMAQATPGDAAAQSHWADTQQELGQASRELGEQGARRLAEARGTEVLGGGTGTGPGAFDLWGTRTNPDTGQLELEFYEGKGGDARLSPTGRTLADGTQVPQGSQGHFEDTARVDPSLQAWLRDPANADIVQQLRDGEVPVSFFLATSRGGYSTGVREIVLKPEGIDWDRILAG
jgi:hypothetical protein